MKKKDDPRQVEGDPGVGGLLADPQEPGRKAPSLPQRPDGKRPISSDPSPPRDHHDWSPNKRPHTKR